MGFLRRRAAGYKAAFRVEKYRAAAAELRQSDPSLYNQLLAQAEGGEAEAASRRDPDAYVALFLAAWDDEQESAQPEPTASERDIDYWPTLDIDAAWAEVTKVLHEGIAERGAAQLYFPGWFVRRLVILAVLDEAGPLQPDVGAEFAMLIGADAGADPMREDASLDDEIDAFLVRNHLNQIVTALVQGLSAEE